MLGTEGHRVLRPGHFAKRRNQHAQPGQRPAHDQLVLGMAQRVRPRMHPNTRGNQCPEVLGGNVLMVEGEHVAALGEPSQRGQIIVPAKDHIGGHQRRRLVRTGGQHPQGLPERHSGLVGHPSQLPGTHHADDRQTGTEVHELPILSETCCGPDQPYSSRAPQQRSHSDPVQHCGGVRRA